MRRWSTGHGPSSVLRQKYRRMRRKYTIDAHYSAVAVHHCHSSDDPLSKDYLQCRVCNSISPLVPSLAAATQRVLLFDLMTHVTT